MVSRGPFEVPGFLAASAQSGMRYSGRPDLALISCQNPEGCSAAGVFTRNRFCAAPVELCRERLRGGKAKAILVNAGIANACTGEEGKIRAAKMAALAASALGCPADSVLVSSTGVIGQQLDVGPVARSIPGLVGSLRPNGWWDAARAIMTTDTVEKMASVPIELEPGVKVMVGGIAKGSGMIAPDMATLLVFVCTDAAVSPEVLRHWTRVGADGSFNCITVDGDTSTNDSLLVLAGGAAGNKRIADIQSPESLAFGLALEEVLRDLAIQIVMDAEGATKLIEIEVSGAADRESARQIAFAIANSPLVKTAFFGGDANWGRIVAAAGRAGVPLVSERVSLFFSELCVFQNGVPVAGEAVEQEASRIFGQKEIRLRLDLGAGSGSFTAWTCDLSFDYIKINASYRS
ncbi:MAG: bifunctional glutamate N-acetyltransferase/amino-acid acetyltransferase ArgJ [Syntrophobacteraceae bacterium]|nr:bifunctional glutamate N-acetyltransferase/amino-acid acetyltransferase ArgJ [Syntrophobacteraceae bacterium]